MSAIRKRYLLWFLALLTAECLIGVFVRDAFIRPYVGDMLITVLLCCLLRVVWPIGNRLLPVWIFLFSGAVEYSQLLNLPARLGVEGTILSIVLGSTFDWKDLLCYAVGCILFALAEHLFARPKN
jgi:hypothetical protein